MKIRITLNGPGGKLDSQTIEVGDDDYQVSDEIHQAIKSWMLSPGDSVVITELE